MLLGGSVLSNLVLVPIVLGMLLVVVYVRNGNLRSEHMIIVRAWLVSFSRGSWEVIKLLLLSGQEQRQERMERTR